MGLADDIRPNWIDGSWSTSGKVAQSHDPATGEVIGRFVDGGRGAAECGIAAARRAFDTTSWSRDRFQRVAALTALADQLTERKDEIITLLARENGKLVPEATFEVEWTLTKVRYNAALALTLVDAGRAAEVAPGSFSISLKEPVGVVGVIVPWNAPVILLIRSLAPALAAGCTAVIKVAPETALTSALLMECIAAAGFPPGVVNMFAEEGSDGARLLVTSPEVDAISYTGSSHTGKAIMAEAAPTLKRLSLELGGKCPAILFEDADFEQAIPTVVAMSNLFAGQFCMQASRILVQRSVADQVQERLLDAFATVNVGPSSSSSSQMGPLINSGSRDRVRKVVEEAHNHGEVLLKGRSGEGPLAAGAFLSPTVVRVDDVSSPLVQQEIFGPVVTLEVFEDDADATRRANATRYGLAASIWTGDVRRPLGMGRSLRAGTIWTNVHGVILDSFEEGGFRDSGLGRLNGPGGVETFLETKHLIQPVALPA
jgi:acyl-CoA reductase-like NAD-dependent aldehyde dehydrogenase